MRPTTLLSPGRLIQRCNKKSSAWPRCSTSIHLTSCSQPRQFLVSRSESICFSRTIHCSALLELGHAASISEPAEPTIYALSTAPGQAAIAIIRVSGPACQHIYKSLCSPQAEIPRPRHAAVRSLYAPCKGASAVLPSRVIDAEAMVLYFPSPKTVTGEDVLELHVHGGTAVVKAVLKAVGDCSDGHWPIRYAEAGEFTRRAFMNGRLNLVEVEALGDTLSAVTEEQRRLAVLNTASGVASQYEDWRENLLNARGELEALIDFSEDQHFEESPTSLITSVASRVLGIRMRMEVYRSNAAKGALLRGGIILSLIGSPNVGKSSLLNQIVGRHAAIVSDEAGTTRDIVEVPIDLGGFLCRFGDTAGLRSEPSDTADEARALPSWDKIGRVEQEGIRRAKARAMESHVVIVVLSVEASIDSQGAQLLLDHSIIATAQELSNAGKELCVVVNKMDRYGSNESAHMAPHIVSAVQKVLPRVTKDRIFCISCHAAEASLTTEQASPTAMAQVVMDPGLIKLFLDGLVHLFRIMVKPSEHDNAGPLFPEALGATERQRVLLESCLGHLNAFLDIANCSNGKHDNSPTSDAAGKGEGETDIVLAAESLRAAAADLARITGRGESSDVEEVLGVVFEKFCVGK